MLFYMQTWHECDSLLTVIRLMYKYICDDKLLNICYDLIANADVSANTPKHVSRVCKIECINRIWVIAFECVTFSLNNVICFMFVWLFVSHYAICINPSIVVFTFQYVMILSAVKCNVNFEFQSRSAFATVRRKRFAVKQMLIIVTNINITDARNALRLDLIRTVIISGTFGY